MSDNRGLILVTKTQTALLSIKKNRAVGVYAIQN
jgi:hypothetical protein